MCVGTGGRAWVAAGHSEQGCTLASSGFQEGARLFMRTHKQRLGERVLLV